MVTLTNGTSRGGGFGPPPPGVGGKVVEALHAVEIQQIGAEERGGGNKKTPPDAGSTDRCENFQHTEGLLVGL